MRQSWLTTAGLVYFKSSFCSRTRKDYDDHREESETFDQNFQVFSSPTKRKFQILDRFGDNFFSEMHQKEEKN